MTQKQIIARLRSYKTHTQKPWHIIAHEFGYKSPVPIYRVLALKTKPNWVQIDARLTQLEVMHKLHI